MAANTTKMLDWDAFRVILAIDREGSLSGAARALGVNQATVGRQLNRAEATLDAKLFHRLSNGLFPTDPGKVAIEHAARIEDEVTSANMKLIGANEKEGGTIRLSIPLNTMPFGLSEDIQAFVEANPQMKFVVIASDQQMNFLDREVDVVIRANNNPTSGLWGYRLADIYYNFYASAKFMEKWRDEMFANPETVPLPFIAQASANNSGDRDQIKSTFPNAQVIAECNGVDSIIPLVRDGVGVARIARYMVNSRYDFEVVHNCSDMQSLSLWVLTHPDYRDTRRIRVFMEFLRDRFHQRSSVFI